MPKYESYEDFYDHGPGSVEMERRCAQSNREKYKYVSQVIWNPNGIGCTIVPPPYTPAELEAQEKKKAKKKTRKKL